MAGEVVKYESAFGNVTITSDDVVKYLSKGTTELTEKEAKLFLELCKYQKLNPFVGEAYAIKYGNDFQLVVGYGAYKRRAEENPTYAGRKSGIVVLRNKDVVQKEGVCLYPGETLIGGWCRVSRNKDGRTEEIYKEVSFAEYDKGQANWKTKPCTMIEKVAVSQALRDAFPKDYAGLYIAEEVAPAEYQIDGEGAVDIFPDNEVVKDKAITQEQRQQLFRLAQEKFGKEDGNNLILKLLRQEGLESTTGMPVSVFERIMQRLYDEIETTEEFPPVQEEPTLEQA